MEESGNSGRVSLSEKLLVSEDEAAQLLSVSKPTFRGMVANGHVHRVALPCGVRRNLYRRSDLDAFVESLETMPPGVGGAAVVMCRCRVVRMGLCASEHMLSACSDEA